MLKTEEIVLFENLAQTEYGGTYFDFHNNFDCVKLTLLTGGFLVLYFKNIVNDQIVKLRFMDATIETLEFFNFDKVENLTIDNLYRGKVEKNGQLIEFGDGDLGYYYLEFDEGQKLEFWSSGLDIEM